MAHVNRQNRPIATHTVRSQILHLDGWPLVLADGLNLEGE